ncbi:MAG: fibronectin type III-like domain-contianing protein, partial [Polyangiales bacterium]
RPMRELRGFARVDLPAGETRDVLLEVPIASLAYFDEAADRWVVEPGMYRIEVGPNAGEHPLEASFEVAP